MQISVVVPVYNVSKYLPTCLDSIVNQTYEDLDIIVVDDGSTDDCPRICDEYGQRDTRIRVIHKTNGGLSDARNVGIEHAKGQYITFVDSDDVIAPDMVAYLYDLLVKYDADMSSCQMMRIEEKGERIQDAHDVDDQFIQGGTEVCMEAFLTNSNFNAVAWSKLYKTSMFRDVKFPKGKWHEDVFTTYRLVAQCQRIILGSEQKYLYRYREGSIMTVFFKPSHMDAIEGKKAQNSFVESCFPSLAKYSRAGIVYAANVCSLRMARSGDIHASYVKEMQSLYRRYEWNYLCYSRSRIGAKLYSLIASINLNLLVHLLNYYYHGRK